MNVLVTGGAGYIGSHIVKLLGEKGFNVLTYDNLSTGNRRAVTSGMFVKADLADKTQLEKTFHEFMPEIVMHLAASVVVSESVADPLKYYRNNVANTLNLFEIMIKTGVKKIIFSSTAAVYGMPDIIPVTENMPLRPVNPYGNSKMTTETILKDIGESDHDFKYVSLRYFNVAGMNSNLKFGQCSDEPTHLISRAIKAAKGEIDKLNIFGADYPTSDGTCIRDYIHVDDIANAHFLALEYLIGGGISDVFNCGYGRGFSVREVINAVKKVTGINFRVEETGRRDGDPPVIISDNSKIKENLGWKPEFDDLEYIIKTAWI